jgi:hypothetical protein
LKLRFQVRFGRRTNIALEDVNMKALARGLLVTVMMFTSLAGGAAGPVGATQGLGG